MSVTIGTSTTYHSDATYQAAHTFAHNNNKEVVVIGFCVSAWENVARTISSVTYGGVACVEIGYLMFYQDGDERYYVGAYKCMAPPSGANNVVITANAAVSCSGGAISLGGVGAIGAGATATGGGGGHTVTVNVPSAVGDTVIDIAALRANNNQWQAWTIGASQVSIWTDLHSDGADGRADQETSSSYEVATGATTTMSWTEGAGTMEMGTVAFAATPTKGGNVMWWF
ncbi:MAG: hypothetical protein NTU91_01160 [Chloroflexi bacterium]|nr:hypothetical protein [Chloroflexota bacterium]